MKAIATDNWGFHFVYNSHMSDIYRLEIYLVSQLTMLTDSPCHAGHQEVTHLSHLGQPWPVKRSFSHSFNKHTLTYCVPGIIAGTEDTKLSLKS